MVKVNFLFIYKYALWLSIMVTENAAIPTLTYRVGIAGSKAKHCGNWRVQ